MRSAIKASPLWSVGLYSATGVIVTATALIGGATLTGPGVRALCGEPPAFNTDYTSKPAMIQALAVLGAALAFGFFLVGVIHAFLVKGIGRQRWQLWTANPLTVGLGYWIYRGVMESALPYEYVGYFCWFYLSTAGSILFAATAYTGSTVSARFARDR